VTGRAVELAPEALAEAQAAERWYAERSPRAAEGFVDDLERALDLLAEGPHVGQRWPHPGVDERVRRMPLRRYPFVLFYVIGEPTRVLAVAHTSREPGYWASRLGET
jgi:plasmid stabilization system protein ParE